MKKAKKFCDETLKDTLSLSDSVPPGGEWQREAEEAEVISLLANQLSAQQKPVSTSSSSDDNPVVASSSSGDSASQQLILTSMSPPKTNIFFNVKKGRKTHLCHYSVRTVPINIFFRAIRDLGTASGREGHEFCIFFSH